MADLTSLIQEVSFSILFPKRLDIRKEQYAKQTFTRRGYASPPQRWSLGITYDGRYQKDGSPRFKTFYGKTQKEVKLKLKEYQDALISGVQLDTILYFEDWADTWFEGHRDNIAPTTQESYKYCLKMLKEGFYHRPLTVIRPIDIENFLKGMRRDGRSDSYISKARGMLYQIFQKAEANDLVRRNPVRLAERCGHPALQNARKPSPQRKSRT